MKSSYGQVSDYISQSILFMFVFTASARVAGLCVVLSRYSAYKQQVNRQSARQTEIINYKLTDR